MAGVVFGGKEVSCVLDLSWALQGGTASLV